MKQLLVSILLFSISHISAQVHDNGIGGYGYVQYDIMHNSKLQGNWMTGGGGLILNKVYFAGLYYGSQTNAFANLNNETGELYINKNGLSDTSASIFNLTVSEVGGQVGGVVFAEKSLQLVLTARGGVFLSNMNEQYNSVGGKLIQSTKAFPAINPEFKFAFMPTKFAKLQAGVGYKFVYYTDSRLKETGNIGDRNTMFNSFYWNFSLVFGSF